MSNIVRAFDNIFGSNMLWDDPLDWSGTIARGLRGQVQDPISASFYHDRENYYVRALVPGFKEDELNISLSGREITVSGKKETVETSKSLHSSNRQSFSYSYVLPYDAVVDGEIKADLKEGILVVGVPRKVTPAMESKTIPIRAAPESKQFKE